MREIIFIISILFFFQTRNFSVAGFSHRENSESKDTISLDSSPVLTPLESIKKMEVEKGFEVKLVAAEPLVNTPVFMDFDNKGRMWVVEMPGYMPDSLGTGEDIPNGKIVILEDKNRDGTADTRKVFLDSLHLPRSIRLLENGILVAETPNLWFYEIKNDKPGRRTLVDDKYTVEGNVEHNPNGLLKALDNWIYSAKFDKRYRKKGDKWIKEQTHFRGQWGITQDDYGRLYYNHNSANVIGDYFSPGFGAWNSNQKNVSGFNEAVVPDNRVYPIRPTPGINRGYVEGMLDKNKKLVNFTAAGSPLIYRGDLFGPKFKMNAFVPEPSANLIKRDVLEDKVTSVTGRQAYEGKEFIASTDERFRPVSLYNGPDGALYVVDMYRGIIQHKTYLTGYLKNEIKKRDLTQPLNYGRIYKAVPIGKKPVITVIPENPAKLVKLLKHPNGYIRDKAQQELIAGKRFEAVPALRRYLKASKNPVTVSHALWTLEGLGVLNLNDVLSLLNTNEAHIRVQALSVIPSVVTCKNSPRVISMLKRELQLKDPATLPYIGFLGHTLEKFDKKVSVDLLLALAEETGNNRFVADAVIANLKGKERQFKKEFVSINSDTAYVFNRNLAGVIADINNAANNSKAAEKNFPKGAAIFKSTCQTCHGADGNGIKSLAPPLNQSEWVKDDKNRLIPIVLFGLTGPIKVAGKVYKAPEITGDMPGIGGSDEFSDEAIAQLLNFIGNSWNNQAEKIIKEDVTAVRKKYKGREKPFTMPELERIQ